MIKMNKKMRDIINCSNKNNYNEENVKELCKSIVSKTKLVHDCVIYDEKDEVDERNINFDEILKVNMDSTGYEANCNEICIDKRIINISGILLFVNFLKRYLMEKYLNKIFCIIFSINDEEFILRFHTYRKMEGLWISEHIDDYESPILYDLS